MPEVLEPHIIEYNGGIKRFEPTFRCFVRLGKNAELFCIGYTEDISNYASVKDFSMSDSFTVRSNCPQKTTVKVIVTSICSLYRFRIDPCWSSIYDWTTGSAAFCEIVERTGPKFDSGTASTFFSTRRSNRSFVFSWLLVLEDSFIDFSGNSVLWMFIYKGMMVFEMI